MIKSSTELFDLFKSVESLTETIGDSVLSQNFQKVKNIFEDKKDDFNIKIMMYGVYNAGKSTLINALLGEKLAETGDVPLTDKIHAYQWKNYTIFDTPGIDAPKAHEIVTETQLEKVDGIIFVVNPQGAVEERKTLEVLVNLLASKRKVFLVLNEKQSLSDENFIRLKDAIRERIQEIAEKKGLQNILKDIPILRINAARAVRGRIEDPRYLPSSGYNELAEDLSHFLANISHQDIIARLVESLQDYITLAISRLNNEENESIIQYYNELLKKISNEYRETKTRLQTLIEQEGMAVKRQSKLLIQRDPESCEAPISALLEESVENFINNMEQEAKHLELQFQGEIQELQQMIIDSEKLNIQLGEINIRSQMVDTELMGEPQSDEGGIITAKNINRTVQTVSKITKPEHIVTGLNLVKEWMPSLMKGVGPKTMEKWAGAAVGRWIPYVGTAVTVLTSVWDMFGADSEDKKMARIVEQQRAEEERYNQQVEDTASQIATNFTRDCTGFISRNLDPWFNQLVDKLKETQGSVSHQKAINQNFLLELENIQAELS